MRAIHLFGCSITLAVAVFAAVGCGSDEPASTGNPDQSTGGGSGSIGSGGKATGGGSGKGSGGAAKDGGGGASGSMGGTAGPDASDSGGPVEAGQEAAAEAGSLCGNNHLDPGEECDDGNTRDGDGCSSICTKKCEECEHGSSYCKDFLTGCYELDGFATAGASQGAAKAELCSDLMACIRKSQCAYVSPPGTPAHADGLTGCYCGESITTDECLNLRTKTPDGPCKAEVEAAAESNAIPDIAARAFNPKYALGGAFSIVAFCDQPEADNANPTLHCPAECLSRYPFPDGGTDAGH